MNRPLPPTPGGPARARSRGRLSPAVLAGWLFADLLLVLVIVTMADRTDPLAAEPPKPKKSSGPSHSPTPTGPRSVAKKAEKFTVRGTRDKDLLRQIKKRTDRWEGRTAAIVLTFGGTLTGEVYAKRVNGLLHKARPAMFEKDETATDNFHNTGEPADSALVRVYFYTGPE